MINLKHTMYSLLCFKQMASEQKAQAVLFPVYFMFKRICELQICPSIHCHPLIRNWVAGLQIYKNYYFYIGMHCEYLNLNVL